MAIKFEKTVKGQALKQVVESLTPGQLEQAEKLVAKHKPKLFNQTPEGALADELITLDAKLRDLEVPQIEKRVKEIKDGFQLQAKSCDPASPYSITGDLGVVTLSPCANKTEIPDPLALVLMLSKKFGPEVAASVLTVNLTNLKQVLSGAEIAAYSETVAGARACKINPNKT